MTSESTSGGKTTMATTSVNLPEVVENVPDDASDVAMLPLGAPVVTDLTDGVTIAPQPPTSAPPPPSAPRGSRMAARDTIDIDGDPVSATLDKTLTNKIGTTTLSAKLSGSVTVTPTVEVGLDMDWFTLKSYKIAAGLKTTEKATLTLSAGAANDWDITLFKVSMTRGGSIGPVPVWATFEGTVKLHVGISGEVKTTVEWTRTGLFMAGLKGNADDGLIPRPYESRATSTGKLAKVEAAGHAEGRITAAAQLSLYSVIGPYAEIGYEAVAEITGSIATTGSTYSCEIYHRPVAAVGIRTSGALAKLTGKQFTPLSKDFDFAKNAIRGCPTGTPTGPSGGWISVTTSGDTSCGIRTDRSGWCWGLIGQGQIGDGTTTDRATPTQVPGTWMTLTTSGGGSSCGVRTDRTGWCWGNNYWGQVGDGTTTDRAIPTQLPGTWTSLIISGLGGTSCGIRTDDTGWCWGDNYYGQVGDGTTTNRATPTQLSGTWTKLTTNGYSGDSCGIRIDHTGWCWGFNDYGQVGDGTTTHHATPTQLPGNWDVLNTDNGTSCGIRTDSTGWCWGHNGWGQAGDGTVNINRTTPGRLPGAWDLLITFQATSCGVRADHTGWCWGNNYWGQVGVGTTTDRTTPTQLPGIWTTLTTHTTNAATSCGVRADHTGWCWGDNRNGQVGDGTTTNRTSPTQLT